MDGVWGNYLLDMVGLVANITRLLMRPHTHVKKCKWGDLKEGKLGSPIHQ